ncbi:DUF1508 domain-containing protein [Corticibacter populi]|uniref:DUF1508 domain-containing protein n=1 Tax=Corticibacter populi TaxID=1550736 RepID=A0A3M6QZK5_9BURK|nr:YegP family protein [Corticibacter populi]RMX08408.1 DUF1508 domain-containing protein [Corticibacter populi]RZS35711.1 hypothetical protein EV687_0789 [Corticibacter populi]
MSGKFELKKTDSGKYRFNLKASNGQVILTSQNYEGKAGALNGIESVRTNAPLDARYDRKTNVKDEPYFNLLAGNSQVIGTSESYSSKAALENGIESVKKHAPDATLADLTT